MHGEIMHKKCTSQVSTGWGREEGTMWARKIAEIRNKNRRRRKDDTIE